MKIRSLLNWIQLPFAIFGNETPAVGSPTSPDRIGALRDELLSLAESATAIREAADARTDGNGMTQAESAELDSIMDRFSAAEQELDRRERLASIGERLATRSAGRQTTSAGPGGGDGVFVPPSEHPGRGGFPRFGDYLTAVYQSRLDGQAPDPRLLALRGAQGAETVSSEGIGADGGWAVPPDWRREITSLVEAEDQILALTDNNPTNSNMAVFPTDETTPWGSAGIQAYWEAEKSQYKQSRVDLQPLEARLHKLTALVPVTEELLMDATLLGSYVQRKTPEVMNYKITEAIIQGGGTGMPLGLLNAPATITVAKEGSQAAGTLTAQNIIDMWSTAYAAGLGRAVWLANQDIQRQLAPMAIPIKNVAGTENVGGELVYQPPTGVAGAPFGSIYGRPIIYTEACNALGSKGDIILADLGSYLTLTRTTGIEQFMSMHLWFDHDEVAFKFRFRMAGQPWLSKPIKARDPASPDRSPFVTLEERA